MGIAPLGRSLRTFHEREDPCRMDCPSIEIRVVGVWIKIAPHSPGHENTLVPSWWLCLGRLVVVALLEEVCHWRKGLRIKCPTFFQLTLSVSGLWFEDVNSQHSAPAANLAMLAIMSSMMESYPLELGASMSSSLSCLWPWRLEK